MRKILFFSLLITLGFSQKGYSWGFWAHKQINRTAVYTLPKSIAGFYKLNINYITDHAVDPDKRRSADKEEGVRHFIDIDHYGIYPYDSLPRNFDSAVAKYSKDSINKYGIVPWYINLTYNRLVEAMKMKNAPDILHYSADLGHYMADASVPLHTTTNYDGQLTGQKGIHSFWESSVPELEGKKYNYYVGKAVYIPNVLKLAWATVLQSNNALDSVLRFEKALNTKFTEDKKYSYKIINSKSVRRYSDEYTKAYSDSLHGQVERRVRHAISAVGDLWYTAWVDAGQPDINKLDAAKLTKADRKRLKEEKKEYRRGQMIKSSAEEEAK